MNKRSGTETREKILEAGMSVFSRDGTKANIREIAKTARISIGAFYLYFRNKEELYQSLIRDRMDDLVKRTKEIGMKIESPREALSAYLRVHLEYALKHKELILLNIREQGFSLGIDEKRKYFKNQTKLIEKIVLRGIHTGEFRKCSAKEVAVIIMGTLRSIILSIAFEDFAPVTARGLTEFILRGLQRTIKEE
jgi:TetR/AcrR family transcriptional regulator, fatty acid metabolism regulator protein